MNEDEDHEYVYYEDEYGVMDRIIYEPIFEEKGIEYVKKLFKEKKDKKFIKRKNQFLNFDKHWDEVEKIEDAEQLLLVKITDCSTFFKLENVKEGIDYDYVKSIENKETKVYYLKYDENKNLRKKCRKR